ncbi:MAG: SMI1/KNR4 family protein [Saprospiraceae bacterium]
MKKLKNFWLQPAKGFTEETIGVSEERLCAKEKEVGFSFPKEYRDLMKAQNGGYLRKYRINEQLDLEDFERLEYVETFLAYLYQTKSEEDLEEMYRQFEFCDPKRLISFASLYGHGVVCFDYGWLQKEPRHEPGIIFINDDGDDFLHYEIVDKFNNFEELLSSCKHGRSTRHWDETALVIKSDLRFENFATAVSKLWKIDLETKTDDRFGWYNFEKYYLGTVPLVIDDETVQEYIKQSGATLNDTQEWIKKEGRQRFIKAIFSPNQHLANTFLFPAQAAANIVIEIKNPWFPKMRAVEQLKVALEAEERLKVNEIMIYNNA